jgi:hypothetical protein
MVLSMALRIRIFALLLFACSVLNAQLLLNEVLVNPPGTDNPFEYIELKGSPGTTINQIFLCVFEGDSASAGNCDLSIPLQNVTVGSNGLVFVGTTIGYPELPSETTVIDELLFAVPGGYLENGNTTFALVFSSVNILEDVDYDTNNDGVLDLPTGAILLDAVGWTNGDQYAKIYGGVVLTQSAGTPDAAVRFYENNTPLSKPAWYNGDLVDLVNFDLLEISDNYPSGQETGMTPGGYNIPNGGVGFADFISAPFNCYPNPTRDFLTISSETNVEQVRIYSLTGSLVKNENLFLTNTIFVGDLPAGCYSLEVSLNGGQIKKNKLVIYH